MRAIISIPFFDTAKNRRSTSTIACIQRLTAQVDGRHTVVVVDNGSTELATWRWLQEPKQKARIVSVRVPNQMSVAQGVNTGWGIFEDELDSGAATAVKLDSDTVVAANDWIERILALLQEYPQVGLAGPYLRIEGPAKHKRSGGISGSDWVETDYVPGAVCARSPAYWRSCGYARNPCGRWGWQDHWDVWRCRRAGLKMVIFGADMEAHALIGSGSLSREHKRELWAPGREALMELQKEVETGKRALREPFDGWRYVR
jgi:hypothetical protein